MPIFEVKGFSGGITDDTESPNRNDCVEAENFNIEFPGEELLTRPGSEIYNEDDPRPAEDRISNIINMGADENLLLVASGKLFVDEGASGINELQGEGSHSAFPGATTDMIASHMEHDGHVYIASDDDDEDGVKPVKVYKDENDDLVLVTAGLPKFEAVDPFDGDSTVDSTISALANDIRTQFLDHYADATRHPTAADTASAALITLGALTANVSTLAQTIALVKELVLAYRSHYSDAMTATGDRQYHSNSLGDYAGVPNVPLKYAQDPLTFLDCAKLLNDLKIKYNWHLRSFRGHPSVGPDVVTAADASETSGPVFDDPGPNLDRLTDVVNNIKLRFNQHIADITDVHYVAGSPYSGSTNMSAAADTESTISLTDAGSDINEIRELAAHLYAAYRLHHSDVKRWFSMSATTDGVDLNKLKSLTAYDVSSVSQGRISDIEDDMYALYTVGIGSNTFTPPTIVTDVDIGTDVVTLNENHSNTGNGTAYAYFTHSKYHGDSDTESDLDQFLLEDIDISALVSDLGVLISAINDVYAKYNLHDASGDDSAAFSVASKLHFGGSLYQISENVPSITEEVRNYIYTLLYSREYRTSDGLLRKDVSATYVTSYQALRAPEVEPVTITSIPAVANDTEDNYDTSNIKIEVYRTTDAGVVPRLVGKIANGTTTFVDNMPDEELEAQEAVYTVGGVVDNDPPPIAKFVHEHNGFGYYGNLKIGDDYYPNDIAQSISGDLDSVPETFRTSLPLPVMGISSTTRDAVAWTKKGTYRLEGTIDERGQGAIIPIEISNQVGLCGGLSPVQIEGGIVFAGTDGFYFTDGYRVTPISKKWSTTYALLVLETAQRRRIQGTYDRLNQRVFWAMGYDTDENDSVFVLHLKFGLREDGGSFTEWNGGTWFSPSAIAFFDGDLIRGESRGYVLRHDSTLLCDPEIDPLVDVDDWNDQPVYFNYMSPAWDFGTMKVKKWVTKIVTYLGNVGKTTVQLFRTNDSGRPPAELRNIVFDGETDGAIIEKRWMPAGSLRCTRMQIQFTNVDDGETDDSTQIQEYALQYEMLGDSHSDAGDEA